MEEHGLNNLAQGRTSEQGNETSGSIKCKEWNYTDFLGYVCVLEATMKSL